VTRAGRGSPLAWLGGLLALYLSVPIVAFLVRLAGSHDRGFETDGLWGALRTSVLSATISTAIIAACGIPLAHWLARSSGPLARIVDVLVPLPLALPPVMSGIILIYVVGPYTTVGSFFGGHLTDSIAGIVLAQTFVAAPFMIIAARSAFASVDPALEDLAATLGHHSLARFWRVSLPIAAAGIKAGVLLTWMRALGEYGATVLLAYHPFSLPVYTSFQFSGTGLPDTQAPTALALAVAAAALLANQLRRPTALRRPVRVPSARHPEPTVPTTVGFDLDLAVGGFRLQLAHQARSHRIAILGPSGSGKSITLRALAGLLGPRVGTVRYGDEPVTDVPTEVRGIGYVPQGLGLFPARTVWQQLCFAVDADESLAAWWLQTLQLDGLADRRPDQLSGGQRQRVGLAQALAHNPRLVLLDEPFSALDAPVREELRRELRRLQHEAGLSTVLVTHDPEEAALLADEILVIDKGRLLQAGPRAEVYNRPASPEVARLLGIQNLTPGTVAANGSIRAGELQITAGAHSIAPQTAVLWCIRPDHVVICRGGAYPARVLDIADIGTLTSVTVALLGGPELRVRTTEALELDVGDACQVDLDPAAITLWPVETRAAPAPVS
jgi:molybdate transport system permease protein